MVAYFLSVDADEPYDRLRKANVVLFGLMPAALLLARGGAEVIMAIIGLSFLWTMAAGRRWRYLKEPTVAILLVTWVLLNIVISPLALDPAVSFSRSLLWIRFVLFFAAVSLWLFRDSRDLKTILVMWWITLVLTMIDGYVQLATGTSLTGRHPDGSRLTGPLDRPNIGMFVARIGLPLLGISLMGKGSVVRAARFLPAIILCVAFTFIILSGDRTASILTIAAIMFGVFVVAVYLPRLRIYAILMAIAVPAIIGILFVLSEGVRGRITSLIEVLGDFWSSPYGMIYQVAFKIWQQNPLTGSGLKGFQAACNTLDIPGFEQSCYPHAHNIYLEWLSESGLIGLGCFLVFVVSLTIPVLRLTFTRPEWRLAGTALCGGLIVTLSPVAATQSFFSNWPAMVMWTALGTIAATTRLALQDRSGARV